jgi:2-C-methyl-D-erythritol 4-phosphate cytidylyltransferase
MSVIWNNKYALLSKPEPLFTVLVAAAGSGKRMGNVYKPLYKIEEKEMIAYSLEVFQKSGFVKQIVVSAPNDKKEEIYDVAKRCGCTKLKCVSDGGETRAESVLGAFRAAFDKKEDITPFVAIHDAARPLVTENIINDVFFACIKYGASVAATKVRDAIKKTGKDNVVSGELDRNGLWQMQTPQAFDTDIYHTALVRAKQSGSFDAVDDASLVIAAGFKVVCVESGFANIKVTYKEDVEIAGAIIRNRAEKKEKSE